MKKILIITSSILFFIVTMGSCGGGYTCPTYSKIDNDSLVKTELQEQI